MRSNRTGCTIFLPFFRRSAQPPAVFICAMPFHLSAGQAAKQRQLRICTEASRFDRSLVLASVPIRTYPYSSVLPDRVSGGAGEQFFRDAGAAADGFAGTGGHVKTISGRMVRIAQRRLRVGQQPLIFRRGLEMSGKDAIVTRRRILRAGAGPGPCGCFRSGT